MSEKKVSVVLDEADWKSIWYCLEAVCDPPREIIDEIRKQVAVAVAPAKTHSRTGTVRGCNIREHNGLETVMMKLGACLPLMPDPELGQDVAFLAHVISDMQKRLRSFHDHVRDEVDYKKLWEDFWKPIMEIPAIGAVPCSCGLNKDAVMRELHDYHFLMGAAGEVYGHVTEGMVSKTNTRPAEICAEHDKRVEERIEQAIRCFIVDHGLCRTCEGAGQVQDLTRTVIPRQPIIMTICPDCKGTRGE